jgi:hypothetical protein
VTYPSLDKDYSRRYPVSNLSSLCWYRLMVVVDGIEEAGSRGSRHQIIGEAKQSSYLLDTANVQIFYPQKR